MSVYVYMYLFKHDEDKVDGSFITLSRTEDSLLF